MRQLDVCLCHVILVRAAGKCNVQNEVQRDHQHVDFWHTFVYTVELFKPLLPVDYLSTVLPSPVGCPSTVLPSPVDYPSTVLPSPSIHPDTTAKQGTDTTACFIKFL